MHLRFVVTAMVALTLAFAGGLPAAADSAAESAIQDVIQRGNAAQVQALAVRDANVVGDTAVGAYVQELINNNQSLLDSDVTAIDLVNIVWGPVSVNGSRASATTFETWRTTFGSGPTQFARDRNVYDLVLNSSGVWKIVGDQHPDGRNRDSRPPRATPPPPQTEVQPGAGTSRNWSGYAARGGTFTQVSATWTVPTLAVDGPFGADATWVGIGGLRSRDLIQAGTQQVVSGSGSVMYQAWVETLPDVSHPVPLTVLPGDSLSVSIAQQDGDAWLISFVNLSSGRSLDRAVEYHSTLASAEWIEEAPFAMRRVLPISEFGSLTFTSAAATRNGQSLSISDVQARPISLIDDSGRALAVPSPLAEDGTTFTVSRT